MVKKIFGSKNLGSKYCPKNLGPKGTKKTSDLFFGCNQKSRQIEKQGGFTFTEVLASPCEKKHMALRNVNNVFHQWIFLTVSRLWVFFYLRKQTLSPHWLETALKLCRDFDATIIETFVKLTT